MRASGILLPISALPSDYGIGTFGEEAYDFVGFLSSSRQRYWQILPLGHTGFGNSPYQCFSAFAGNPYYIDPMLLFQSGYIEEKDLPLQKNDGRVDYGNLYKERINLVLKAAERVDLRSDDFTLFEKENSFWLDDYSLFMAVKESLEMKSLKDWDEKIRLPDEDMLNSLKTRFGKRMRQWKAVQFIFYTQWNNLKKYAALCLKACKNVVDKRLNR